MSNKLPIEIKKQHERESRRRYYLKNKEKMVRRARENFLKLKSDPIKYAEYLQHERERYQENKKNPLFVEKINAYMRYYSAKVFPYKKQNENMAATEQAIITAKQFLPHASAEIFVHGGPELDVKLKRFFIKPKQTNKY